MTYDPNKDRAHWRMSSDTTLIEAARHSDHELAIALGERLEDVTSEDVEHLKNEIEEQAAIIALLRRDVNRLEHLLTAVDAED
jgi:hypothetical protein